MSGKTLVSDNGMS